MFALCGKQQGVEGAGGPQSSLTVPAVAWMLHFPPSRESRKRHHPLQGVTHKGSGCATLNLSNGALLHCKLSSKAVLSRHCHHCPVWKTESVLHCATFNSMFEISDDSWQLKCGHIAKPRGLNPNIKTGKGNTPQQGFVSAPKPQRVGVWSGTLGGDEV